MIMSRTNDEPQITISTKLVPFANKICDPLQTHRWKEWTNDLPSSLPSIWSMVLYSVTFDQQNKYCSVAASFTNAPDVHTMQFRTFDVVEAMLSHDDNNRINVNWVNDDAEPCRCVKLALAAKAVVEEENIKMDVPTKNKLRKESQTKKQPTIQPPTTQPEANNEQTVLCPAQTWLRRKFNDVVLEQLRARLVFYASEAQRFVSIRNRQQLVL